MDLRLSFQVFIAFITLISINMVPNPSSDSMRSLQSQVPGRVNPQTGQPMPKPRLAQPRPGRSSSDGARPQAEQQTQAPAPAKKWYTNKILWAGLLTGGAVAGTGYLTFF